MNTFRFDELPTAFKQRSRVLAFVFLTVLGLASAAQSATPTISAISSQGTFPSTTNRLISFTVADAEDAASSLVVTGFSGNESVLPNTNIFFSGSGSDRTVSLIPAPAATGSTLVSIVVTDSEGLSATNVFNFDVNYLTPLDSGIPATGFNPRWADYDNDGDLDIFVDNGIYRNDGRTNFSQVATLQIGWSRTLHWVDYDADGDLDLGMGNLNGTFLYRNEGNDIFANALAGFSGPARAATWGDYDNDGKLDLLTTGGTDFSENEFTHLYRNTGNGFTLVTNSGLPVMANSDVEWGDFDRDGNLDVLINGVYAGISTWWRTEIYRNKGDGTFTNLNAGLFGLSEGSVSIGDYDNDGDLDLLSAGFNFGSYQLRVYRNNGNNTFTDLNIGLQGSASGDAQWVDFDNDSYLDIFIAGCTANFCATEITTIYRNNRNGTFSNVTTGLPVLSGTAGSWGDFDGDGDLDLFYKGLYRNNCPSSNSAPEAPSGLVTELLADNNVRLRWAAPGDSENTNSAALNYAVYVGTTPGAGNFVPAHANTTNGFRRISERGLINTNSILLKNVPQGTYHWSVQAIDAGFAGSSFASATSFTITNTRPVISAIATQRTVPNRTIGPINFTISDKDTGPAFLSLSATTSNTNLVPLANIVLGGVGNNPTVTITPAGGFTGTANIGLVVSDGGLNATSKFDVVVQPFTKVTAISDVPTIPTAFADLDNDGDLDVARNSRIYTNNAGSFNMFVSSLPVRKDNDLAWVDYDNDGDLDLSETGWDNNGYGPITYIFRYNGGTNFTPMSSIGLKDVADGSIAWGDYDNDGRADALITGDPDTYHTANGFAGVFRNLGGTFTNIGLNLPTVCKGAGVWGDLDNDGDLDFILSGQNGPNGNYALTRVYRNDRNNVFIEISTTLPALTECGLALGDCDKDGDLDIAFSGFNASTNRIAGIYLNNGYGTFTNSGASLQGLSHASVAWGDYNNDGLLDLAMCGLDINAHTLLYRNTGTGFVSSGGALTGGWETSLGWGDYDKDGDLDLLVGTVIMRNDLNQVNTAPSVPLFPYATVSTNRQVRFRWSHSTDTQSSTNGLSYNLRIGTTPGGSQIKSAHGNPANGYLRVPQLGNVGQTNSWTMTLPYGKYYWSVQAVDGGYTGSIFAPEEIFILENNPPIAFTPLPREVLEDQTLPFSLSGVDPDGDPITFTITAPPTNGTLIGTAPHVTYRPNTNYFGNDTLKFFVHDGTTNSATASVSIRVTPVDDVPNSTMQLTSGPGLLQMTVAGEPHQNYALLVSTDLVQWLNLTNLQCSRISGTATWSETNLSEAKRFYRLQELP